jgi:hypothetical protein
VVGQGNCPAGSSDCQVDNKCNDNSACKCHQRLEGGTRCVQFNDEGACDQCETDADCLALGFSPGSSCIRDDGPECFCNADAKGFCGEPCGFVTVTTVTSSGAKGPRR